MSRIAFVSPLPPEPTGIADYAADVVGLLAPGHDLELFHDQPRVEVERLPASCAVHRAAALLDRHRRQPYDVAVYQMGNAPAHAFLYPLLARVPGLLVLHDLVLHHSRARMFLESEAARAYARDPANAALRDAARASIQAYRDEVTYCHPPQGARLADAHLGTVGDLLPYAYPLFRIPVEASRVVAVHNRAMAEAIRGEIPGTEVVQIPMPVERAPVTVGAVSALRERHGLGAAPVVASFGLLTREKRIETVARAAVRAAAAFPELRLLLVGPTPDPDALGALLQRVDAREWTVVTGRVPFGELPAYIELADAVVHLRWPTARETSAALLRVLAQGRPTVIADLENLAEIPREAVLRADVADEEGEVTRALLRLLGSPPLRRRLGEAAAAYVRRAHAPAATRAGYEDALDRARQRPDPPARPWPAAWRD